MGVVVGEIVSTHDASTTLAEQGVEVTAVVTIEVPSDTLTGVTDGVVMAIATSGDTDVVVMATVGDGSTCVGDCEGTCIAEGVGETM